jgi:hypothetical protein
MLCVAAFTWRVFRPSGRTGATLCAVSALGLVVAAGAEITTQWRLPDGSENPWTIWFTLPLRTAIYVWATYETLDYWWKLRRRERIGLVDPLVVNRLFLWGLGLFAILVLWIHALMLAVGPAQGREVVGSVVTTALVLVCAASHWLAFFPPAVWRRRFAERSSPA